MVSAGPGPSRPHPGCDLAWLSHNPKAWRRWSWIEIRVLTLNTCEGCEGNEMIWEALNILIWMRQNQLNFSIRNMMEHVHLRAWDTMIELLRARPSRPKSQSSESPVPCDSSNFSMNAAKCSEHCGNCLDSSSKSRQKPFDTTSHPRGLSSSWLESSASKIWRVSCKQKNDSGHTRPNTSSQVQLKMIWQSSGFKKAHLMIIF